MKGILGGLDSTKLGRGRLGVSTAMLSSNHGGWHQRRLRPRVAPTIGHSVGNPQWGLHQNSGFKTAERAGGAELLFQVELLDPHGARRIADLYWAIAGKSFGWDSAGKTNVVCDGEVRPKRNVVFVRNLLLAGNEFFEIAKHAGFRKVPRQRLQCGIGLCNQPFHTSLKPVCQQNFSGGRMNSDVRNAGII